MKLQIHTYMYMYLHIFTSHVHCMKRTHTQLGFMSWIFIQNHNDHTYIIHGYIMIHNVHKIILLIRPIDSNVNNQFSSSTNVQPLCQVKVSICIVHGTCRSLVQPPPWLTGVWLLHKNYIHVHTIHGYKWTHGLKSLITWMISSMN